MIQAFHCTFVIGHSLDISHSSLVILHALFLPIDATQLLWFPQLPSPPAEQGDCDDNADQHHPPGSR